MRQASALRLCREQGELLRSARIVVGQHHERWDGDGYPCGLKGHDIHLFGRIEAVADVFDALTTRRCYKEPWPIEQVADYFKDQSGKQFYPMLVETFLGHLPTVLMIKERWYDSLPAEEPRLN